MHIEWQFGGWLREWPLANAVALFAFLGAAGIFYIVWFYRHTTRELAPRARRWLAGFRAAVVLLLLLCLANPERVEKAPAPKSPNRNLTVLVDRSASMSAPDHRGGTRLASALRRWRQVEPSAKTKFFPHRLPAICHRHAVRAIACRGGQHWRRRGIDTFIRRSAKGDGR